ncbi:hypothetical protein DC077_00440 [Ignatzschineria cameli]|uniref:Fimbrial-type adhesion domain-containing protein n=2 Tax=Ignatzschineria cameli TaxID=2182793 RepID=A0A2U2ASS2_9GAMM|nr:hypothetical protein DC077_00440 [Ignatzschineria cameli]
MKIFSKICSAILFFISVISVVFGQGSSGERAGCQITNYSTPWGFPKVGPSTGMILPELTQNKILNFANPIMTYTVSCPGNITVMMLSAYTPWQMDKVDQFWREVRPSRVSSMVHITVTPIGGTGGAVMRGSYDIMNKKIIGGGNYTYTGTAYTPAKVVVRMQIEPLYFYSNFYKDNYSWEIMDYTYFTSLKNGRGEHIAAASIYPNFFMRDEPCLIDAYKTIISTDAIDFGNLSKNEIEAGKVVSRSFDISLTRNSGSCSGILSSPRVTFIPQDYYENNNIYLENGLMMTFKDTSSNRTIPMAKAYDLGRVSNNKLKKTISVELKKGNKGKNIKSGPFSSTVIYLMEYY